MTYFEKKLAVANKKLEILTANVRGEIAMLCGGLIGRVNELQDCNDVVKELKALNGAIEIYLEILDEAKGDYDYAKTALAEDLCHEKQVS